MKRIDKRLYRTLHYPRKIMRRETYSMVCHPALRIIVGSDLGGSIPCSHLRFSHSRALRFLFRKPSIEQPGSEDLHPLHLVLQLGLLILLRNHYTGRDVRNPHRRICGIYRLSPLGRMNGKRRF